MVDAILAHGWLIAQEVMGLTLEWARQAIQKGECPELGLELCERGDSAWEWWLAVVKSL